MPSAVNARERLLKREHRCAAQGRSALHDAARFRQATLDGRHAGMKLAAEDRQAVNAIGTAAGRDRLGRPNRDCSTMWRVLLMVQAVPTGGACVMTWLTRRLVFLL